jgi:putative ABC transport system substrate-binding protein
MQVDQLKRREFITLLGSAVASWPRAARAQQPGKLPTVGFLGASWASRSGEGQRLVAFLDRLHELGWLEGRTLSIEYRWAEGRNERFTEIASEFARLKLDVIVTYSTPAVIAVKQVTSVIPVIFAGASDPVGTGLVASLARPGGNITGVSLQTTERYRRQAARTTAGTCSWSPTSCGHGERGEPVFHD